MVYHTERKREDVRGYTRKGRPVRAYTRRGPMASVRSRSTKKPDIVHAAYILDSFLDDRMESATEEAVWSPGADIDEKKLNAYFSDTWDETKSFMVREMRDAAPEHEDADIQDLLVWELTGSPIGFLEDMSPANRDLYDEEATDVGNILDDTLSNWTAEGLQKARRKR